MLRRPKSPFAYAGMIGKLASTLVVPILIGFFLGDYLDQRLESAPWMTLLLLMLGVVVGFGNLYRFSRRNEDD